MKIQNIRLKINLLKQLLSSNWLKEQLEIERMGNCAYYTNLARTGAVNCGENLKVNYPSAFGAKVYFGNNCNFNGMRVQGGEVHFGNNFHSGV